MDPPLQGGCFVLKSGPDEVDSRTLSLIGKQFRIMVTSLSSNRSSSYCLNNTVLHAITYQSRLWRKTVNKINDLLNRVFLNLNFYDNLFLFWKFRLTSNCYNDLLTTMVYFKHTSSY